MNILEKIIEQKKSEVKEKKQQKPLYEFEKQLINYNRKCISLKNKLIENTGIIAEFKRKSPSKGEINPFVFLNNVVRGYEIAGASGISILTDMPNFGGSTDDLLNARLLSHVPLLRKDFIIDLYQIAESKAIGADLILLIAAVLTKDQIIEFTDFAHEIGLEVLLELHDENEIDKVYEKIDMLGINNRNLKTFQVDISISEKMIKHFNNNFVMISESGINSVETVKQLISKGYRGFLMGEIFMRDLDPGKICADFINKLNT